MKSVWQKNTPSFEYFFKLYLIFDNAFISFQFFAKSYVSLDFLKERLLSFAFSSWRHWIECLSPFKIGDLAVILENSSDKLTHMLFDRILYHPYSGHMNNQIQCEMWLLRRIVELHLMVVLKNHALGHNLHYGTLFGACDKRKTICTCSKTVFSKHLSLASITN